MTIKQNVNRVEISGGILGDEGVVKLEVQGKAVLIDATKVIGGMIAVLGSIPIMGVKLE